jgi:hypothetical protein
MNKKMFPQFRHALSFYQVVGTGKHYCVGTPVKSFFYPTIMPIGRTPPSTEEELYLYSIRSLPVEHVLHGMFPNEW